MAWVKLHTDILNDPKLMRAARRGAKGLEWTPWLFAFAKAANDSGRLTVAGEPADPEDLAAGMPGATPAKLKACTASLEKLGVLVRDDDGALRFAKWEQRAGKPSDQPESVRERVQRHRDRKRNGASNATDTPDATPGNALQGALRHATEVEEEEEGEGEGEAEEREAHGKSGSGSGDHSAARAASRNGRNGAAPPAPLPDPLPLSAHPSAELDRFLAAFYATAAPQRRADVVLQLDQLLTADGTTDDQRRPARCHSPAERDALLRAVTDATGRARPQNPDLAVVFVLRKAADGKLPIAAVTDAKGRTVTEAEADRVQRERAADDAEARQNRAIAAAWKRENPEAYAKLRTAVDLELGIGEEKPLDQLPEFLRLARREALIARCVARAKGCADEPPAHAARASPGPADAEEVPDTPA